MQRNCNELSSIKRQKLLKCVFLNFQLQSFVDSVSVTRFGFVFNHQKFISKAPKDSHSTFMPRYNWKFGKNILLFTITASAMFYYGKK